jgi:DNA-binding NarL/FixJ family response regulator
MRLLLADSHPIVLDGLEHLFAREHGIEVIASCQDGEEALTAIRRLRPDVTVLDIALPRLTGLEIMRRLREESVPVRTVIFTASISNEDAVEVLALGAKGLVLKHLAPEVLVRCVNEVHAGRSWIERNLAGQVLELLVTRAPPLQNAVARLLTARELEISRLVASGCRNRQIAEKLTITEGTVKIHLNRIYEKLLVTNRVELANLLRLDEFMKGSAPR